MADNSLVYERYPCPYQVELKSLVAKYRSTKLTPGGSAAELTWHNVFVGVGSDEAIDMLMRIFCVPGQVTVAWPRPPGPAPAPACRLTRGRRGRTRC